MESKNFSRFIKVLQIASGILMLGMVVLCIVLMNKYNIKVTNIPELADMIEGGALVIALGIMAFSVVKSFALVFPPAVVFSICGYLMPNYFVGVIVNAISVFLSLSIPYFLGKFTGSGMVDALKTKFKAVKKIDAFAGANEVQMTFVVKLSGLLPGDLSSLLFGAMNVSYKNYMIGTNLGNLPLVLVYTGFGVALKSVGEKPWLAAIPVAAIIFFVIVSGIITKKMIAKNKAKQQ
ncbi:MAG: TVP38/TMEM64 family protein [Clostridia bacterium]|nr:TVP38/TMEM64 family protein [Clostridia bacterium]